MRDNYLYNRTIYHYNHISEEEILENIEKLATDDYYTNLMFTQTIVLKYESSWEPAARVLAKRGFPKIADVIPEMFEWLQDMNWPGANEIWGILMTLPREVLIHQLEQTTLIAKKSNDVCWLYYLREFMEQNNLSLNDFDNQEVFYILESSVDM